VVGQSLADDVAQSFVARGCGAVDEVSGFGKLGVIPELVAGELVLLNAKLLQASDIVLIRHLIHLGVYQKLIGISCNGKTFVAQELGTIYTALSATEVMRTDLAVRLAAIVFATVPLDIALSAAVRVPLRADTIVRGLVDRGQSRVVLSLVHVLQKLFDDGAFVVGKIDFAFFSFLKIGIDIRF
jgi:hypothetical protein